MLCFSCQSSQGPTSSQICSLGLSPRVLFFQLGSQILLFSLDSNCLDVMGALYKVVCNGMNCTFTHSLLCLLSSPQELNREGGNWLQNGNLLQHLGPLPAALIYQESNRIPTPCLPRQYSLAVSPCHSQRDKDSSFLNEA